MRDMQRWIVEERKWRFVPLEAWVLGHNMAQLSSMLSQSRSQSSGVCGIELLALRVFPYFILSIQHIRLLPMRQEEVRYARQGIFLNRQAAQETQKVARCLANKDDAQRVCVRLDSCMP